MKTAVIYKSKTGFTKQYAVWLAEALEADLLEASKTKVPQLAAYDTIIYGGGLYASGINGVKLISQHLDQLKGKKIVVFATGLSPARAETINEVRDKNFTAEAQKQIRFFYLRGGFDFNKLKPLDKVVMSLMKRMIQGKKEKKPDEREMLTAFDQPVDYSDRQNIAAIVKYVNS
jgi:menaquinone-dependent protoporphyrinogen IX oxidase